MPRKSSRQDVEAVGLSNADTVHFIRTEDGEPKLDGEVKSVDGKPTVSTLENLLNQTV